MFCTFALFLYLILTLFQSLFDILFTHFFLLSFFPYIAPLTLVEAVVFDSTGRKVCIPTNPHFNLAPFEYTVQAWMTSSRKK